MRVLQWLTGVLVLAGVADVRGQSAATVNSTLNTLYNGIKDLTNDNANAYTGVQSTISQALTYCAPYNFSCYNSTLSQSVYFDPPSFTWANITIYFIMLQSLESLNQTDAAALCSKVTPAPTAKPSGKGGISKSSRSNSNSPGYTCSTAQQLTVAKLVAVQYDAYYAQCTSNYNNFTAGLTSINTLLATLSSTADTATASAALAGQSYALYRSALATVAGANLTATQAATEYTTLYNGLLTYSNNGSIQCPGSVYATSMAASLPNNAATLSTLNEYISAIGAAQTVINALTAQYATCDSMDTSSQSTYTDILAVADAIDALGTYAAGNSTAATSSYTAYLTAANNINTLNSTYYNTVPTFNTLAGTFTTSATYVHMYCAGAQSDIDLQNSLVIVNGRRSGISADLQNILNAQDAITQLAATIDQCNALDQQAVALNATLYSQLAIIQAAAQNASAATNNANVNYADFLAAQTAVAYYSGLALAADNGFAAAYSTLEQSASTAHTGACLGSNADIDLQADVYNAAHLAAQASAAMGTVMMAQSATNTLPYVPVYQLPANPVWLTCALSGQAELANPLCADNSTGTSNGPLIDVSWCTTAVQLAPFTEPCSASVLLLSMVGSVDVVDWQGGAPYTYGTNFGGTGPAGPTTLSQVLSDFQLMFLSGWQQSALLQGSVAPTFTVMDICPGLTDNSSANVVPANVDLNQYAAVVLIKASDMFCTADPSVASALNSYMSVPAHSLITTSFTAASSMSTQLHSLLYNVSQYSVNNYFTDDPQYNYVPALTSPPIAKYMSPPYNGYTVYPNCPYFVIFPL